MRKMPTLFVREFEDGHKVNITDVVTPGCEWVIVGMGVATRKVDGVCVLVDNGHLYKRYDAKAGRPIPATAIPCQATPDTVTGHFPCWMPVSADESADKWFVAAFEIAKPLANGTYELCGPHFNANREGYDTDVFVRHGSIALEGVPRTFDGLRKYLQAHNIEGIVFHRGDGAMCKIKRSDFGFPWRGVKAANEA